MATKNIIIGAAGVTTFIGLIIALQMMGLTITSDGDKLCSTRCESIITVKNPTADTVSVVSKEVGNFITFSPSIERFELYKKSGTKWIPVNFSAKGTIMSFSKYSTSTYKLVVFKRPEQTIKWSFGSLDPYYYATYEYNCTLTSVTEQQPTIVNETCYQTIFDYAPANRTEQRPCDVENETCIRNETGGLSYLNIYTINEVIGSHEEPYECVVAKTINVTTSWCDKQNIHGIDITIHPPNETKYISCEDVTCSIKNDILTLKKFGRGADWNDKDLDSCYNKGVPCLQYNLTTPDQWKKVKEYQEPARKIDV